MLQGCAYHERIIPERYGKSEVAEGSHVRTGELGKLAPHAVFQLIQGNVARVKSNAGGTARGANSDEFVPFFNIW